MKELRFRWAAICAGCGTALAAGSNGFWDSAAKSSYCVGCGDQRVVDPSAPLDVGAAGASAAREHERRVTHERKRQESAVERDAQWRRELIEKRPVLGRLRAAMTERPEVTGPSLSTKAWSTGAEGERRVAEILASCGEVIALHDRRIPGSKANIDHLAVSSRGVFVIDAKKYTGAIEVRDVGPLWRAERRLHVGGRNRTKLVDGVRRQMDVVRGTLEMAGHTAPVHGVLCFVDVEWPLVFRRPLIVEGVVSVWPSGLPDVLGRPAEAGVDVDVVARALADLLPAA